jgi:hypothetical protein
MIAPETGSITNRATRQLDARPVSPVAVVNRATQPPEIVVDERRRVAHEVLVGLIQEVGTRESLLQRSEHSLGRVVSARSDAREHRGELPERCILDRDPRDDARGIHCLVESTRFAVAICDNLPGP